LQLTHPYLLEITAEHASVHQERLLALSSLGKFTLKQRLFNPIVLTFTCVIFQAGFAE